MSEKGEQQAKASGPAEIAAFVVAKMKGGKFLRFQKIEDLPKEDDAVILAITNQTVSELTKDQIGEIYSQIVGTGKKNFKDKRIAIESLVYQVAKMPIFDPNASPLAAAVLAGAKANKPAKSGEGKKYARKTPDTFELLQPPDVDKVLKALAPQARELVLIMADLAKEKGSTTFSGTDLNAKLETAESKERLRTRQPALRILQYYKGRLIGDGLIRTN